MQKALEEKGIELKQAKLERIPLSYASVTEDQVADITKLLDKLEEDEDVQAVYHNMEE
jgi:transcriptional/translational regulatory protein YebC/TACO1